MQISNVKYSLKHQSWLIGRLQHLAKIVREADTSHLDLTPQSAGLYAISLGLSQRFTNDHEMLAHVLVVYDALYAWFKECQGESHNHKDNERAVHHTLLVKNDKEG
ncbi:chromate resistance protein [Pseudomonas sp. G2-4]|nr:chromate resistance protein ChrB domain-containing protein [Pseudomonas sp. G2-4]WHS61134.1 chromate resistance protein [Pseudomonas sp. G2-4]